MAGLIKGSSIYVANNDSPLLSDEVMYDFPGFVSGKAYSFEGVEYELKGRYVYPTGEVEILINGRKINRLNPSEFPVVQLGNLVYVFVQFDTDGKVSRRFAFLKAGEVGPDKHAIVTTYQIEVPSNTPTHRGIVQAPPSRLQIDSTNYLIGDRPLAVAIHRKLRRATKQLTPCAAEALEKSSAFQQYGTTKQLRAFIKALDEDCTVKE